MKRHNDSDARFSFIFCLVPAVTTVTLCLALGCQSSHEPSNVECGRGQTKSCRGNDGCRGERTCNSEGQYSACSCKVTALDGGTPERPAAIQPATLGGTCNRNSDCPAGAQCLTTTSTQWLGGAPTASICVADCTTDAAKCDTFKNATCVESVRLPAGSGNTRDATLDNNAQALCLPLCEPDTSTVDQPACSDVAGTLCEPLDDEGVGFCRPTCTFDEDCGAGHCDRQVSVCVAKQTESDRPIAFGEACNPDGAGCNGVCVELSPGYAVCSNRCSFGDAASCASQNYDAIAESACGYASIDGGPGDLGYCAALCDNDDDCLHESFVCDPFPSASIRDALGYTGFCSPP